MAIQTAPVQRRLVSEAVYDSLLSDILAGRLEPDAPLPSERALSEGFAVNRHAVREAIKRLQQAGLVQVAQGGATRVRDWRRTAGLDLLVELASRGGEPELERAIMEMRAAIGADVARLCAERSPGPLATEPSDDEDGYIAFWEAIVDGADNLAYRLALNTLVAAQRTGAIAADRYAPEWADADGQRALARAVDTGDGAGAQAAARSLLEKAVPS